MHIPSIKALRALEAVARLGSVRRAADDLHLTRSAVSHQLRFLEAELGFVLTEREGRGVRLTRRGERYAREVRAALRALARAREESASPEVSGRLTVSCTPGFATYWLCRNIGRFLADHPNVDLAIVSPRRLDDVTASDVDLFIAYGQGGWRGMWSELLAEVRFSPICSPRLLQQGLRTPADIARFRLLHLGERTDWRRWLAAARLGHLDGQPGIVFSDMNLVLSAALAGQGIAMGDTLISRNALATGELVRPFPVDIPASGAYHLAADPGSVEALLVRVFLAWLRGELAATGSLHDFP